jgi:ketosteroid isomerase-like protein
MEERDEVAEASERFAAAIARRDLAAIRGLLAPDFIHRTHGGAAVDAEAFVRAIEQIPGEILRVKLEQVEVDMSATGALVTGIQHAQVLLDGRVVDDRGRFVDWFVKRGAEWRIQAAVDLPGSSSEQGADTDPP